MGDVGRRLIRDWILAQFGESWMCTKTKTRSFRRVHTSITLLTAFKTWSQIFAHFKGYPTVTNRKRFEFDEWTYASKFQNNDGEIIRNIIEFKIWKIPTSPIRNVPALHAVAVVNSIQSVYSDDWAAQFSASPSTCFPSGEVFLVQETPLRVLKIYKPLEREGERANSPEWDFWLHNDRTAARWDVVHCFGDVCFVWLNI